MHQDRDDEATGEELFVEELGQVHGGRVRVEISHPIPTLARMELETGVKEPVLPRPPFLPIPRPITTQMLNEDGITPPPPAK